MAAVTLVTMYLWQENQSSPPCQIGWFFQHHPVAELHCAFVSGCHPVWLPYKGIKLTSRKQSLFLPHPRSCSCTYYVCTNKQHRNSITVFFICQENLTPFAKNVKQLLVTKKLLFLEFNKEGCHIKGQEILCLLYWKIPGRRHHFPTEQGWDVDYLEHPHFFVGLFWSGVYRENMCGGKKKSTDQKL